MPTFACRDDHRDVVLVELVVNVLEIDTDFVMDESDGGRGIILDERQNGEIDRIGEHGADLAAQRVV